MIDLTGIIAISGQSGLFKVVAQTKNGIIVEGLTDKKRSSISSTAKVSSLEDISMFTTGEDKPVAEIMKSIFDKENGGPCLDSKSDDKAVTSYFESVLPDYDKERVYTSNMKKLFTWYNGLQSTGNLKVKEAMTYQPKSSYSYDDLISCGKGLLFGPCNAKLPLPPMLMVWGLSVTSGLLMAW